MKSILVWLAVVAAIFILTSHADIHHFIVAVAGGPQLLRVAKDSVDTVLGNLPEVITAQLCVEDRRLALTDIKVEVSKCRS